jgi:Arc/MetJ-type ribon-helix-helix transcriptional regulator
VINISLIKDWVIISVKIPRDLAKEIEEIMMKERYATVSEVVREALREWVSKRREVKSIESGEVA